MLHSDELHNLVSLPTIVRLNHEVWYG